MLLKKTTNIFIYSLIIQVELQEKFRFKKVGIKINIFISDGIPISTTPYEELKDNQVWVVDVIIQDGTIDLIDINVNDFVHNKASQNDTNYFYKIKDLCLFTIEQDITIREICEQDEFINMVIDMIKNTELKNKQ